MKRAGIQLPKHKDLVNFVRSREFYTVARE